MVQRQTSQPGTLVSKFVPVAVPMEPLAHPPAGGADSVPGYDLYRAGYAFHDAWGAMKTLDVVAADNEGRALAAVEFVDWGSSTGLFRRSC